MKKVVIFLIMLILMQTAIFAQVRDTIFLDNAFDSSLTYMTTRFVGDEISKHSISLTNNCNAYIDIQLSANNKDWKQFSIGADEEKLFVTGSLDKLFLWIDPKRNSKTKFIIYKGDKYEILWSSMDKEYILKPKLN
jgi:hypothetical protein